MFFSAALIYLAENIFFLVQENFLLTWAYLCVYVSCQGSVFLVQQALTSLFSAFVFSSLHKGLRTSVYFVDNVDCNVRVIHILSQCNRHFLCRSSTGSTIRPLEMLQTYKVRVMNMLYNLNIILNSVNTIVNHLHHSGIHDMYISHFCPTSKLAIPLFLHLSSLWSFCTYRCATY